ncbi:alpha-hydroxy acid oxidase [Derxia gummosa]|uniref:Alpha-hydroxy acid oxidase n=1 Tax=Derxia gummosa DSM 723 TaxID=1121388 RepID=A0A8B6XBT5_9BURK|nr:alpha-hydroxy acid oxidase [Derxia gummosa]
MSQPDARHAPLAQIPPGIACARDYELLCEHFIPAPTLAYLAGGAGHDRTRDANLAAFDDWTIWPRLLRDVTHGHTRLALAGAELSHPFLLAPVAFQKLVHPGAETETARAAAALGACLVASTLSSAPLEDIATANADGRRWFQLYFQPERAATQALARRAEAAGYEALVVTLDAAIRLPSLSALRAGFVMPADCAAGNLQTLAASAEAFPAAPPGQSRIFQGAMRAAPGWADLDWLRSETRLPVWVKGVLHPDDAADCRARGIAGVIVSNHGGRALDGAPASLAALPGVRAAVGADYPLLFDGGIRSGGDAFKALALGANAVLVGRLQVWALSVAGALGVAHVLKLLREELEACMAQAGCATLADIGPHCLAAAHEPLAAVRAIPPHPCGPAD